MSERSRHSAGIVLWRMGADGLEVLLGHPGGPFFAKKDDGSWSVLKGEIEPGEDPYAVARREFEEESGSAPPNGDALSLGDIQQRGGKLVTAWALEGDLDPATAASNTFEMEWPPHSGNVAAFPEIDRVEWFDLESARRKIRVAQIPLLDRLEEHLQA